MASPVTFKARYIKAPESFAVIPTGRHFGHVTFGADFSILMPRARFSGHPYSFGHAPVDANKRNRHGATQPAIAA
jgi:hypothetical protein